MNRFLVLSLLLSTACSSGGTPTTATPAPFPLPPGAPADAAAPATTRRITITAIEISDGFGARVQPDALKVNTPIGGYRMRVWVFCPAGLEGPVGEGLTREVLDFVITKLDLSLGSGGTVSGMLRLDPGYNVVEDRLAMLRPGRQSVRIELRRNFAVIAMSEFIATFN